MKALLIVILVVFAVAAGAMAYLQFTKQAKIEQQILDIRNRKDQILKLDSLRTIVEVKIYDSLYGEFSKRDVKIKALEIELSKTRKKNEELQKIYNSTLRLAMPEY